MNDLLYTSPWDMLLRQLILACALYHECTQVTSALLIFMIILPKDTSNVGKRMHVEGRKHSSFPGESSYVASGHRMQPMIYLNFPIRHNG